MSNDGGLKKSMTDPVRISVIIPTQAEGSRRERLLRAIECILTQKEVRALPLVVINGGRYDASLRQQLESRTDIRTFYCERASVTEAQAFGVEQVGKPSSHSWTMMISTPKTLSLPD
jgi:hypothetical protein